MRQAGGGCETQADPGRPWRRPLTLCLPLSYSSSQDEAEGKPKVPQQEDGPKGRQGPRAGGRGGQQAGPCYCSPVPSTGVDEHSESSEESEEEKPPEEDKEEEEEKKAPTPQEKRRRKGGLPVPPGTRTPGLPLGLPP